MAIQITDDGQQIKLVVDSVERFIPKEGTEIKKYTSGIFLNTEDGSSHKIPLSSVTVPVVATVNDLFAAVDTMLETIPATPIPTGAATEAKQDSQITELQAIKGFLDDVETKLQAIADNTDTLEVNTDELESRIGEVSATPTVNTVQDRLKGIKAVLDTIDTSLNNIEGEDFATETTLVLIKDSLDTVEAKLQAIADNTDTLELNTDELEARLGEISATPTVNTIQDRLKGIKSVLDAIDTSLNNIEGEDFATQTTLAAQKAVIDLIKAKTDNLDVALSTRSLEATQLLIKAKTDNIDAALSTLFGTLGQKASVGSAPVVLSTEQEVIINAIKTAVEAIETDTGGLATETTLSALNALVTTIDGVLDAIKLDTANLDVALSTVSKDATLLATNALLTTIDAVIDAIKLDTANLDVALSTVAKETTLLATNVLLTTMDAVLDAIKLDTANLDVALSTRNAEATQLLIKAKTDNLDVALSTLATETTLNSILTELQLKADLTEVQPVKIDETGKLNFTETQLVAPGATPARDASKYSRGTFQYVIAAINTDVTVRFEGSQDGTNWYNLDINEVDTTKTANGTYAAKFTGAHENVRFNFVSETGGTTATIDVKIKLGN